MKLIFETIDSELDNLNSKGFPMSLSLYQVFFGIFLKNNIVDTEDVSKITFYKSDTFLTVFPELKEVKIKEFEI